MSEMFSGTNSTRTVMTLDDETPTNKIKIAHLRLNPNVMTIGSLTELSDFLAAGQFRRFLNLKNRINWRNSEKSQQLHLAHISYLSLWYIVQSVLT